MAPVGSCHTPTTPTTPLSPAIVAPPTTLLEMIRRGQVNDGAIGQASWELMLLSGQSLDRLSKSVDPDGLKQSQQTVAPCSIRIDVAERGNGL